KDATEPPRFTRRAIAAKLPVTEEDLFKPGTRSIMTGILEENPGMRGKVIGVDPVRGGGGFLKPGDLVDVLATIPDPVKGEAATKAMTIEKGVLVLAINQTDATETVTSDANAARTRTGETMPRYVTLGLTAAQVEGFKAIESVANAKIELVLRARNAVAEN